jgi:integrase
MAGMTAGPTTRNSHRRIVVRFAKRQRRALTAEEAKQLLDTVRRRPLEAARRNRGGRGGKKPRVENPADLSPETVAKLKRRGRERRLLYRLALTTGLRRGELAALKVTHLDRQRWPCLNLPPEFTKNRKGGRLLLTRDLTDELRRWVADTGKRPRDPVVYVPSLGNLSCIHRAQLKAAGIDHKDAEGRVADFHSLRKTANVLPRLAGVPLKERQLFLRHGKAQLTDEVYEDANWSSLEAIAKEMNFLSV